MKKKVMKYFCVSLIIVFVIVMIFLLSGIIWIDEPSKKKHPVRGVDVSHYQGDIDWSVLSTQNITFAFIKATEGSGSQDECFEENWENIKSTKMRRGAYHYLLLP